MEEQERDADVAVKLESCLADNDDPARVQAMLEQTISPESQETVSSILQQVSRLSVAEKLLLYLRLPASRPDNSPQVDRCSRGEMQRSVAWVRTHLAPQPAVSLPRQHVYREYTAFAARQGLKPVSSADFGKAVKAAFPDVRPRRLGVRGQSRYCYAGVGKATALPAPTLPGREDWHHKRLCKRPSSEASEFVDFSTVAPLTSLAINQSRPGSVTAGQSRPGSVTASQSRPGSVTASQSRPGSITASQSRPGSVTASQSRPGSIEPIVAKVNRRQGEANRTNRRPAAAESTNERARWRAPRFVPIGPHDWPDAKTKTASSSSEGKTVPAPDCASPDLDAELLQYFAQPGPSVCAEPDVDQLCRLRRVLQRSLQPKSTRTSRPRNEHTNPTPPAFDLWGRGPPSPPPNNACSRGYLTAPPSPLPNNACSRGYLTAPPSPGPVPSSGRGYLTAPSSPTPYAPHSRGHSTAPPSPLPLSYGRDLPPSAVIGRGYVTAPPSPLPSWPMAAWRSQSVPPVPPAFRHFDASTDGTYFGAWDNGVGFQGLGDFELACQPADLNAASALDLGLGLGGQILGLDGQSLGLGGQTLGLGGQTLGLDGQSLGLGGQILGLGGQTLGMEGQTLGLEGQTLGMEGQMLDMSSSELLGAFRQSLVGVDTEFGSIEGGDLQMGQVGLPLGQGALETEQGALEMEPGCFDVAQATEDALGPAGLMEMQSAVVGGRQMAMDIVSYELSQGRSMPPGLDLPPLRVRCGRRQ